MGEAETGTIEGKGNEGLNYSGVAELMHQCVKSTWWRKPKTKPKSAPPRLKLAASTQLQVVVAMYLVSPGLPDLIFQRNW